MDTKELRAFAEAATPGPWHWTWDGESPGRVGKSLPCEPVEHCGYDSHCVALTYSANGRFSPKANAEYIAALSPARVLRMIDALEKAEKALERAVSVASYTSATVSVGNQRGNGEWVEVHGGRAGSAYRQLRQLEEEALAALQALKEET